MHFEPGYTYHVYNRGNYKAPIFFNEENYLYLLRKVRNEWLHYCDVFNYCLMPNHFHFTLKAKPEGCENIILLKKETHLQNLSRTIGHTLSSYTKAVNIQNNTIGSNFFQKKTKAKHLHDSSYLLSCFHYIHNNPLAANLVKDLRHWPYSSWLDYYGFRNGVICNKKMAMEEMGLSVTDFRIDKEFPIDPKVIDLIW